MDIGIHMNKYNMIRKNIGNAGNYFSIDPFQSNLYDTFQRKQTSKQSFASTLSYTITYRYTIP